MSKFHIGDIVIVKRAPKDFSDTNWTYISNALAGEVVKITEVLECRKAGLKEPFKYAVDNITESAKQYDGLYARNYYFCGELLEFRDKDIVPTIF